MQRWMISANGKVYRHAEAFEKWGFIDWRQHAHYQIGDEVYIYCTKPNQKVMYKTVVEKESMSIEDIVDDREYWNKIEEYEKAVAGNYARLRLVEQADREQLSLKYLKQHGLKGAPQGPIRVSDELAQYIDGLLDDNYSEEVFPESDLPHDSYEGAVRRVCVNKYERSSIARQRCIEYHGCNCYICGMNFEERYGELGKGFIHVHHIIPLNQIGKEYVVDYQKDLIPVCPNCHAMLHRKLNGRDVTIKELKEMMHEK